MHFRVPLQPTVVLRFVGIEVVQHNMDLAIRMGADHLVHEVEEFTAATTLIVCGLHQSRRNLQRREQCRRAVAFVSMTETVYGFPIGKSQIALGSLQGLDGWFLIDR